MYVVIFDRGGMGYTLAKTLLDEGHEVLILEKSADVCAHIIDDLGSVCIQGDGCEVDSLTEAGVERADMFIALTNEDEDNLVACQLAKHRFNVPCTIARVNDSQNELIFTKLGIDVVIDVTELIAARIYQEVATHPLVRLLSLKEEGLEIVEIKILPGSPVVGSHIGDIKVPSGTIFAFIMCEEKKPLVPTRDTILEANDRVIALVETDKEEELLAGFIGD